MSHFICPECGAHIVDSPRGYLSGCSHYPMESRNHRLSANDYCNSKLAEAHLPQTHAANRPLSDGLDAHGVGEIAPAEEAVEGAV